MVKIITFIVVLAATAGGYYYGVQDRVSPPAHRFVFIDAGVVEGIPQTKVQLFVGDEPREVGTYAGTCVAQENDLLPGETEKNICWYAGGGYELGVFAEDGKAVLKIGEVGEGDAENAGFRGNFKTVMSW
jgi:hypothetical protein